MTTAPAGTAAPERRSRDQRSTDSQTRILDAAVECLIDGGYSGATTLQIQARAGVSRGRLLHHFRSRDVLLVAAAHHLATQLITLTERRVLDEVGELTAGPARVDRVIEVFWENFHEPHFWASMELWTAARTNPELAEALVIAERRLGASIRGSLDRMLGARYAGHPGLPRLADLLLTSMRGAALAYAFVGRDPAGDPHVRHWQWLARTILLDGPELLDGPDPGPGTVGAE